MKCVIVIIWSPDNRATKREIKSIVNFAEVNIMQNNIVSW